MKFFLKNNQRSSSVEQLESFPENNLLLTIQDGKFVCKDLQSPDIAVEAVERAGAGGVVRNVSERVKNYYIRINCIK